MHKLEEGDSKEMEIPNLSEKLLTGKALERLSFMGESKWARSWGMLFSLLEQDTKTHSK